MDKIYKVVKGHKSDKDNPIILSAGDRVKLGKMSDSNGGWPNWIYCTSDRTKKEGWTPIQILKIEGAVGIVIEGYNAIELTVSEGDILKGGQTLNGWVWCEREADGGIGWVPEANLEKYTELKISYYLGK